MGLDTDAASFASGQAAVDGLKGGLGQLVSGAEAMIHKFVELVAGQAEAGKEIEETAQATGLSTDELQRWRKAAAQSGVDAETFSAGQNRLIMSMGAASKGAKEQAAVFAKMGIKVKDSEGHLRDTGDVMLDMTDHFSKMADGTDKVRLAQEIFGRNLGGRFIPLLNESRVALQARMDAAVIMSEEEIKAGKDLVLTQKAIGNVTKGIWKQAISPLLPAISELLKKYLAWQKANGKIISQRIASVLGVVIGAIKLAARGFGLFVDVLGAVAKQWKLVAAIAGGAALAAILANREAIGKLILKYVDMGKAATLAGLKAAGMWLLSVAPLALIAVGIAAVIVLIEDVYQAFAGGESVIGDQIKAWQTGFQRLWEDPRFAGFRRWLQGAADAAAAIGRTFKNAWDGARVSFGIFATEVEKRLAPIIAAVQHIAAVIGVKTGAAQFMGFNGGATAGGAGAAGPAAKPGGAWGAITDATRAGVGNLASRTSAEQMIGPIKYTAPEKAGGQVTVKAPQLHMEFHITPQPGQSPKEVALEVRKQLDAAWAAHMEEANVAVGGG